MNYLNRIAPVLDKEMFGPENTKYEHQDDATLVSRYQNNGDLEVLGALYHRYMHLVYGVSLKYFQDSEESKDAVMQIFEKLVTAIPKQEINNFKSWLYVVTKNHCLMSLRKKRLRSTDNNTLFMESDLIAHPNDEDTYHEIELEQFLMKLPEHQQLCIKMFYYQNKSYQQISQETGFELKKVKSYIQNGKRKLKIYMEDQ